MELTNLKVLSTQQLLDLVEALRRLPPFMPSETTAALAKLMASGSFSGMYEWGAGGSTLLAVAMKMSNVTTTENDITWVERLSQLVSEHFPERRSRLHFRHVDFGATKNWGYPVKQPAVETVAEYAFVDQQTAATSTLFVVDGRYRLLCAREALLKGSQESIVFFDDYRVRPQYWGIEAIASPIAFAGHAAIFQCSGDFSSHEHQVVPDAWRTSPF